MTEGGATHHMSVRGVDEWSVITYDGDRLAYLRYYYLRCDYMQRSSCQKGNERIICTKRKGKMSSVVGQRHAGDR